MDGHAGTCNEKVFRVCGADGHSYRFRVGTKGRRTKWQLDVRGRNVEGREGRRRKNGYEKGSTKTSRRDKPKSSTREGAIGIGRVSNRYRDGGSRRIRGDQNHADINCPTPLHVLSAGEAEEKWWPYSRSLRAWLSSTLLGFENPVPPVALSFR